MNDDVLETATAIWINGERLIALPYGAIFWPAMSALIVADLHFEKGSSFAKKGILLPPYDTKATLKRLAILCDEIQPKKIVSLGDAFHDDGAEARMDEDDALQLEQLVKEHDWLWVLGNHDPKPPARFDGAVTTHLRVGGLFFTHEPRAEVPEPGELAGHLHPCARVRVGNGTLRRRCFIADSRRMVLPAFGAYTGGLNVLEDPFVPLFDDSMTAWVMGNDDVYPIAKKGLMPESYNNRRKAS